MRLLDIQFSFPFVLLVILIVAVVGPSLVNIIICLGVVGWTFYARLVRAEVLRIKEEDYVQASLALGASNFFIISRHILPNILAPIIVLATLTIPRMIIIEASLSWLGLSVPPPTPTWGSMVAESRNYLTVSWWMATFPGIAIMLVVLCVNLLGDWLRDTLDPKLKY
jgi:peptide/nickel transport system permease protein